MRLAVLILLALCLGAAPAPSSAWARERAVDATGAQLLAQPRAYAMKLVRLRGRIDQCSRIVCWLCPETATEFVRGCIGIGLGEPGDGGILGLRVGDTQRELYRFATVTLEGRFDPHCLIEKDIVCTDGMTMLHDVRILKVWSRQSATDGLVTGYADPLVPTPPEEAKAMLAAFLPAIILPGSDEPPPQMIALDWDSGLVQPPLKLGLVCVCLQDSCDGRWPSRHTTGFKSPANPYECYSMLKDAGGWRPSY